MGDGGNGGGCPSPSVQKPIISPRAKNQGPSKKLGPQKGENYFLKNYYLTFLWLSK